MLTIPNAFDSVITCGSNKFDFYCVSNNVCCVFFFFYN